jgi:putative transposase
MVTPAAKREAVAHLQALLDVSERRACRVIVADRSVIRYQSRRDDDGMLREKLRDLAHQRRRFGYRRLHILLRREGLRINRKKTQRLYREEGLTVRRRKGRKRAVGARAPAPVPALPNQRWSLDFVHDQMATGRRFRVLNVVDDVTRECLAAVPDTSISGKRVVRELTELIAVRGKPGMIVSDNGTELTSRAILQWQEDHAVQ